MIVTLETADAKVSVGNKKDAPDTLIVMAHVPGEEQEVQRIELPAALAMGVYETLGLYLGANADPEDE